MDDIRSLFCEGANSWAIFLTSLYLCVLCSLLAPFLVPSLLRQPLKSPRVCTSAPFAFGLISHSSHCNLFLQKRTCIFLIHFFLPSSDDSAKTFSIVNPLKLHFKQNLEASIARLAKMQVCPQSNRSMERSLALCICALMFCSCLYNTWMELASIMHDMTFLPGA